MRAVLFVALILAASFALAHPGHGGPTIHSHGFADLALAVHAIALGALVLRVLVRSWRHLRRLP